MRAAILHNARDIRLGEAQEPRALPGQVLVKTAYASICGTDVHVWKGEFQGRVAYPAILGHEFSGTVVEQGQGVDSPAEGTPVAVDPLVPCLTCLPCSLGQTPSCRRLKLVGIDLPGGFGEYVAVAAPKAHPVPAGLSLREAALAEVYAIGLHAATRARLAPGEVAVLLGAGKLGLSILEVLRRSALRAVIVVDLDDFRLERAKRLHADYVVNNRLQDPQEIVGKVTGHLGADVVLEAVGAAERIEGRKPPVAQALELIRPGGRVVLLGQADEEVAVHWKSFVWKEAEVIASRVTRGEFPRALDMLAAGHFHPELLITNELGLAEAGGAFQELAAHPPGMIKVLLRHG